MGKVQKDPEDPLVAQAFDASKHEDLARAIEKLSSEEAQFFLAKLEAALKKRKLQLTGYLVAMGVWLVAMVAALYYVGATEGFAGWAFLVPFGLVALILMLFGRWSERVGRTVKMPTPEASSGSAERSKSV